MCLNMRVSVHCTQCPMSIANSNAMCMVRAHSGRFYMFYVVTASGICFKSTYKSIR